MKLGKLSSAAAALFIAGGTLFAPAVAKAEQPEITVNVDGLPVQFNDAKPILQNDRTLVPFRAIAESMNIHVEWNESTRTVTATNKDKTVKLQIGNRTAYVNNAAVQLDVAPIQTSDYRTLIPARFFMESFGGKVDWDQANQQVIIKSPPSPMTVTGFYALGAQGSSSWTDLFNTDYPNATVGNTDIVSQLSFGWYTVDRNGNLLTQDTATSWNKPDGWQDILAQAAKYKLGSEMMIHMNDSEVALSSLLKNESAMQTAVSMIVRESVSFNGVNLDFEGLGLNETGDQLKTLQQQYTHFAVLLKTALQGEGKKLTLTLHPPNGSYKGYDYKALSGVADQIIIMAYEYGSSPEPVDLVLQAVKMALDAGVPREKLLLGISVPNETAESILVKAGIAKRYNLNGIALWRLGLLPDDMWQALRTTIQVRQVQ